MHDASVKMQKMGGFAADSQNVPEKVGTADEPR